MQAVITYLQGHPTGALIILYLLTINIWVFILCGADKYRAKRNMWRVKEKTFFILSILGASPFMLLGMYTFRHKTKHFNFVVCIPMILVLQIVLIIFLEYKYSLLSRIFL